LYKQFDQLMTDLLTGLPGEDLGEWVKLLLQPWRWPGMGWRYWQMQTVGQKLAQLVQQMAQLEQQRVVTAVIDSAYNTLLQALCRVEGHVEELADLLRQVQERLVPDGRQAGEPDFYSQLVSSPAVEAAEAATACGGLGVQLLAPDDVGLESALATAGKDRFTAVLSWTAMEALERLLADESAWREWWQTLWQDADPLWRYDAAQLAQGSQGRHSSLVAVAAAGVTDLKERFHGGESSEIRWVETPDSRQIILLRLRAGLVIGS
jgi:hypothetical protein